LLRLKANAINDNWPKHKILYHLLQYDIEHQNLEGAEQKLYRMMAISDSLHKAQMDRTILEYQRKFDTQVEQEAHQRKMIWVGIALGVLLFVIVLLALYIRYRRAKEQVALAEKQMLINNYVNEIAQLKSQQNDTDVAGQIEELNGKIRELVEQNSPRLVRGKMLYDDIKKDGTTSGWSNDDYKYFIDFYKAIDFRAYNRIQKKYQPKTAHNTFFLILYEMGMDDKDVRRIMGVTQEAIRSTRHRIQQNTKK
jgi:cell division protein FtsB